MGKHGMTHSEGLSLAQQIVARLAPACERIEIAGSLRRGKPEVGDIELVAIPRPVLNLFGEPTEHTEITHALASWGVSLTKNGPKYKQFMVGQVQVDLFLATEDNFGLIHMIRTGGADFSRQMVTPKAWGGLLPAGLKVEGGQVWHGAAALSVPDEAALFALWGMAFVEPAARNSAQAVPA